MVAGKEIRATGGLPPVLPALALAGVPEAADVDCGKDALQR